MTRPTLDSRGVYQYRRKVPTSLRGILKRSEWKRSLGTRDPEDAKRRAVAVAQECDQEFALARAVLEGSVTLDASDAQQLAARWFREELEALEASGDYAHYLVVSHSDERDPRTGEELGTVFDSDVRKDDALDVWYLSISPGDDKSIKTASSRRKVPLHPDLIALGLITYRAALPVEGRLFPKLEPHPANGYGHAVGKAWTKYLREHVGLNSQASPSHGFRHTFKTLAREVGIPADVSDWLTGHAAQNVGARYGSNPLSRMAQELEKLPSIAREAGLLR